MVELGAAIKVASMVVPCFMAMPSTLSIMAMRLLLPGKSMRLRLKTAQKKPAHDDHQGRD
jgi:hypothetical protein